MIVHITALLPKDVLKQFQKTLATARWNGESPMKSNGNYQLPETDKNLPELRRAVMDQLQRNSLFFSATLPRRLYPPSFTRIGGTTGLVPYVDNSVRMLPGTAEHMRTDLCCTIFLNDADDYEGGEIFINDTHMMHRIKFAAGDAVVYPATRPHRIEAVTRGTRLACTFWVESMVRDEQQRKTLFDMDIAILNIRQKLGETESVMNLSSCYHNLLRFWAVT